MKIELEIINETQSSVDVLKLEQWVNYVISELTTRGIQMPSDIRFLRCLFFTEEKVRDLNKQFRSQDKTTDVLSFAPEEPGGLGELVFNFFLLERQAKENQHTSLDELRYLTLHGILHLLGYDHENGGEEEKEMMELQDDIWLNSNF